MLNLNHIANVLRGHVAGKFVMAPGPGHRPKDRSMKVWINEEGRVAVCSFAGDDNRECRRYVYEKLGIPLQTSKVHTVVAAQPLRRPKYAGYIWLSLEQCWVVYAVFEGGKAEKLISMPFEFGEGLAADLAARVEESMEGYIAVREEGIAARNSEWALAHRDMVPIDLTNENYEAKYGEENISAARPA